MLIYIHTSKDFFEALVKLEWIKGQKGSPSFISVKIGPLHGRNTGCLFFWEITRRLRKYR